MPADRTSSVHTTSTSTTTGSTSPPTQRGRYRKDQDDTPPLRPIPTDLLIPDLPRGPNSWREAIKQWDGDPSSGLLGLKDWPDDWFRGASRTKFGSKRSLRKLIAEEYERYPTLFLLK
ncbi:hypothetical protein AX17_006821 [Amanita inopinata Kibby_2008]|nr:hypothetical protein AX17_006821 [Amanita inopinata Kibby_2008]